jgi:integrase/recombinase XerC
MLLTVRAAVIQYRESDRWRKLAPSTRKYRAAILATLTDVAGSLPMAKLSQAHVDRVVDLGRASCSETSLNNHRTTLRQFVRWAGRGDLAEGLARVRAVTDPRKRKPLSGRQALEIIELATHPRDRIAVAVLIFAGLRLSELCSLRWRDVDFAAREFRVWRSKTGDWLTSPWPCQLESELIRWRDCLEAAHGPVQAGWYVACARRPGAQTAETVPTKPIIGRVLRDTVKRLMRQAGETDLIGRGPHTLRRTAATLLLTATGGDTRAVQAMLGHGSVATTEIYLDRSEQTERLRRAMGDWRIV